MDVAVIPARAGSKRLPGKNTKSFLGTPMLTRAINVAKSAGVFSQILVSTDCADIADLAKRSGAEAPFLRESKLSGDDVATVPVIKDTILRGVSRGKSPETVTAIYPCTPLLLPEDLIAALNLVKNSDASYVFPISEFPSPPERAIVLDSSDVTKSVFPENAWKKTQDFTKQYFDAGQFYCGKTQAWLDEKELHNNSRAIIIPSWRAVDIDTEADWIMAERYFDCLGGELQPKRRQE